jgi:SAM-dependent methyltransferase
VLECGSGIGALKTVLPSAITSDLFPNPWLDRVEDVYALSFPAESLSAVILFDVFHHLQYPGTALAELARVLKPGGRVILWEPGLGLLGRVVLGLFHHEPLGLGQPITWSAPPEVDVRKLPYYAAQGNAWRIFARGERPDDWQGWKVKEVAYFPALSWIFTGGFRGPDLSFWFLRPLIRLADRLMRLAPRLFASRLMVVLDRTS